MGEVSTLLNPFTLPIGYCPKAYNHMIPTNEMSGICGSGWPSTVCSTSSAHHSVYLCGSVLWMN